MIFCLLRVALGSPIWKKIRGPLLTADLHEPFVLPSFLCPSTCFSKAEGHKTIHPAGNAVHLRLGHSQILLEAKWSCLFIDGGEVAFDVSCVELDISGFGCCLNTGCRRRYDSLFVHDGLFAHDIFSECTMELVMLRRYLKDVYKTLLTWHFLC